MNLHDPIFTSEIKSVTENTDYPKFISPLELLSNITPPGYGAGAPYWWMIPEDRTQAPPQGPLSPLFVESAYRQMLALIRQILDENAVAIGFLDHIRNFVIGEGSKVQFHLPGDDADAANSNHDALRLCHRVWEEWREQNDWGCGTQDREDEAFRRLVRDGETTLRFFGGGEYRSGLPQIRFVEPEQIRTPPGELPEGLWGWGVFHAEDDAEHEECYWIADLFDADSDGEEVDACRIVRVKANVDRCVKRGISDFYPVKDEVTRIHNLLGNMGEVAKSLSTLAYIREHAPTTTASQVQSMISSGVDYQNLPRLSIDGDKTRGIQWYDQAQVLDVSNGQKFVAPPVMTGAQSLLQVEQAMLRAVGLRWGCPEYFSGDASNANFASTLVAGGPFERAARKRQQRWAGFVVAIVRRVFEFAETSGRLPSGIAKHIRIQATLPSVAIANRVDETKRRETLFKNKVISRQTWAQEEGYDDKKEFANIKDDEKNLPPEKEPGSKVGESVEGDETGVLEARKSKPKQGPQHAAHDETIDGKKFHGGEFLPKDDGSSSTAAKSKKGKDATATSPNDTAKAGKRTLVRGANALGSRKMRPTVSAKAKMTGKKKGVLGAKASNLGKASRVAGAKKKGKGAVKKTRANGKVGAVDEHRGTDYNENVVVFRYKKGPRPTNPELAIVHDRLKAMKTILTDEATRLINSKDRVGLDATRFRNLENNSCAWAAIEADKAAGGHKAKPLDLSGTLNQPTSEEISKLTNGHQPQMLRGRRDDLHEELHKALPKPGSRGVVVIRRADNSPAHACNAENINGKIWLFEAHDGVAVPIGKLSTGESHQPRGVVGVQGFYRLESVRKSKCYDLIITNAG